MELRLYLQMILRSWWIILLTALSALVIALIAVYITIPIYQSTARFVVSPNIESDSDSDVLRSLDVLDKRSIVVTYAEVLNSERIYRNALDTTQIDEQDINDYSHTTVVLPEANVLELSVEGPDPVLTKELANNLGNHAINYISELYKTYEISFMDPATQPTIPIRPQPMRDAILAFSLGILAGVVLAVSREQLRTPLEMFLKRTQVDNESGAYNRRYFLERMVEMINRSDDTSLSLGLVQLEGLTDYLQVLPQPVVQQIYRQITEIMRNELRGNDVVGRWENNTFSILLPDTTGTAAVSTLGRVQEALAKPMRYSPDEEMIKLNPKVGISVKTSGDSARTFYEKAENALTESEYHDDGIFLYQP